MIRFLSRSQAFVSSVPAESASPNSSSESIFRRGFLQALVSAAAGGALSACNLRPSPARWPFEIGDLVICGKLNYTVLEVEYKSQLGLGPMFRLAKNMFILLRLQITTSADGTYMPLLRLESEREETIPELEDASQLEGWLGVLRRFEPGTTEIGWIAFDAPPGKYGLWLTDGIFEDEHRAAVLIPVQIPSGLLGAPPDTSISPTPTPVLR